MDHVALIVKINGAQGLAGCVRIDIEQVAMFAVEVGEAFAGSGVRRGVAREDVIL
jgi:hypothetical protein